MLILRGMDTAGYGQTAVARVRVLVLRVGFTLESLEKISEEF